MADPKPPGFAARTTDGARTNAALQQEVVDHQIAEGTLRAVVEGVEAETGDRFFSSLVRHLASALDVQYAFVSELTTDRLVFKTYAVWGRGTFLPNVEIPLKGTPCEAVLNGQMSHYPENLQALFPEDVGLVDWGAVSYCGVPLIAASERIVGHLAILDDKPMHDGPRGLAIMRIFAVRACAELDRLRAEQALRESEERVARILASAMDAIVTLDDAGQVVLFNAAAERTFGCSAAEAIGAPFDRFLSGGFRAALARSQQSLQSGGYIWAPEGLSARRTDGAEFPFEATISQTEANGRRLYTLILRDIDERRQAEAQLRQLDLQNQYLQEEIRAEHNVDEIVGQSSVLDEALAKVALVARTDSSVLILGETGTGKELIARALHSGSRRKHQPLIKVNCAALPTGLIESELFGHEKGAFTGATERRMGRFELADSGTIFLDEIGEMPADVQAKLLRVLQEQEFERIGGSKTIRVDVRVIAATNRDLDAAVAEGRFRQDLYYRLNVFPIALPALRDRAGDIPLLVHFFVSRFAAKIGRPISRVPKDTMQQLVAYPWPGNVRELENVIERAVILSPGPDLMIAAGALAATVPPVEMHAADARSLEDAERSHIVTVLEESQWRIEGPHGAAAALGMRPSTLRSRMKKLAIQREGALPRLAGEG